MSFIKIKFYLSLNPKKKKKTDVLIDINAGDSKLHRAMRILIYP